MEAQWKAPMSLPNIRSCFESSRIRHPSNKRKRGKSEIKTLEKELIPHHTSFVIQRH